MQKVNIITARALLHNTPGKAVCNSYQLLNLLPFALETGDALAH